MAHKGWPNTDDTSYWHALDSVKYLLTYLEILNLVMDTLHCQILSKNLCDFLTQLSLLFIPFSAFVIISMVNYLDKKFLLLLKYTEMHYVPFLDS